MNSVLIVTFQTLLICSYEMENIKNFELLLLHTNNINFHFEEDENGVGGAAKALYLLNKFRDEAREGKGAPVLYLNAGDNFSQTRAYTLDKWDIIADYLNLLRPDAICLGNHDLNAGLSSFTQFLQRLRVPIVASNIDFGPFRKLKTYVKRSHVLTINNRKIGIIGATTSRTKIPYMSKRISIKDEIDNVRKESARLHDMGVEIIILLSHSGCEIDETIARIVEYVDVIVSGHKTSCSKKLRRFRDVVKRRDKRYVPIVHDGGFMRRLGAIRIVFDERGDVVRFRGEPILLHAKIPLAKEMVGLNATIERFKRSEEVLADSRTPLSAKCHSDECNYANLLTDAICNHRSIYYNKKDTYSWTDYPIAIINGGTVMKKIGKKGPLTMGDVMRTIYYDNTIVLLRIQGQFVRKALQQGLAWYGDRNGGFLHFSGLHVTYNLSTVGDDRIQRIFVRCSICSIPMYEKLKLKEVYNIIVNEYMYSGHDGITAFKDNQVDHKPQQDTLGSLLTEYLKRYKSVTPEHDRRLLVRGGSLPFHPIPSQLFTTFMILFCIY